MEAVFFEILSLRVMICSVLPLVISRKFRQNSPISICYIDASNVGLVLKRLLGSVFGYSFTRLEFKLMDIKDESAQIYRMTIPSKDGFLFRDELLNNQRFQEVFPAEITNRFKGFLLKALIDPNITDNASAGRLLYLIQVVAWTMNIRGLRKSLFYVAERPWLEAFKFFSDQYNIELRSFGSKDITLQFKSFFKQFPFWFTFGKGLQHRRLLSKQPKTENDLPKLFIQGRGDYTLENNGLNSDFFFLFQSELSFHHIVFATEKNLNPDEVWQLEQNGLQAIQTESSPKQDHQLPYYLGCYRTLKFVDTRTGINIDGLKPKEKEAVLYQQRSYNYLRSYWRKLIKEFNIKVFLSWYKFDNRHIAIADAMEENGGISAIWQLAYNNAVPNAGLSVFSDIEFCMSNIDANLEPVQGSSIPYCISIGYVKDYVPVLLQEKADAIRMQLKANGATKVITCFDENSIDDSRWHTGHELQRDNYRYLLERVLSVPWLGVIFKPKAPKTLRMRLGPVSELLAEAEKTGRCMVLEDAGVHTSLIPPVYAALASDVAIHGHLCAGTSAVESALAGIPTLLIDRERYVTSQLQALEKDLVRFDDWPEAVDAVLEHFANEKGIPGFGDWSSILDDIDPFRDGNAAQRMGDYLSWLIEGYKTSSDKDLILANAAERYAGLWGSDKVRAV